MKIAIIGSGNVGGALARGLKGKGYSVTLGVRHPASVDIAALARETDAAVAFPAEAAAMADLVILALPWSVAELAVKELGPLTGKVVIDCMNPLAMIDGALALQIGHSTSGGEIVQSWLPEARVVKTLNQVGAEIMADNTGLEHRPVQFLAGNDESAKMLAARLLASLGFEPLDAGDITRSRLLEPFGMVWINQALIRGKGREWAMAAVQRSNRRPKPIVTLS